MNKFWAISISLHRCRLLNKSQRVGKKVQPTQPRRKIKIENCSSDKSFAFRVSFWGEEGTFVLQFVSKFASRRTSANGETIQKINVAKGRHLQQRNKTNLAPMFQKFILAAAGRWFRPIVRPKAGSLWSWRPLKAANDRNWSVFERLCDLISCTRHRKLELVWLGFIA